MRTTNQKQTEKITNKFSYSVSSVYPLSSANVVLTLTTFERQGGET